MIACFVLRDRARLQVALDVARVEIRDAHEKAGSGEGPQFAETESRLQTALGMGKMGGPGAGRHRRPGSARVSRADPSRQDAS